ncbi:metalloregulator ArsR/SmtB family transcription factor [Pseudoalteromonas sp. OF7H-1]|uniref:metalloregulator ArsR/SmtB family transcription factor n=1 Tax=Pseudoalteromonas sp. OF7H-1 TaxID=2917755 RepID=UPI001EF59D63|nr:metalloregulator ArsR/SmtB family transcription factor [Pseudoalteromonas sp. OF7H-1]MCG7539232.1 metalloregulator ArsR/SmtB family transcription factor [Pseudoalteromonas sp. OF7H-1]
MMKILFLCSGNSTRSILAQALANFHGGSDVHAYSAGTKPSTVNATTLSMLRRLGINTDNLYSKHLNEYKDEHFDVVVTLCSEVQSECEGKLQGEHVLAWDIASPAERSCSSAYEQTLFDINEQVISLLREGKSQHTLLTPLQFYKSLADEIRLKTLAMLTVEGELCVCELMAALEQDSQPKVSRHLAQLKKAGILCDRKQKQWVFYSINPTLPLWMKAVINATVMHQPDYIKAELVRLNAMGERPTRMATCCN